MTCGSEIGALLVDGLGDGILIACPSQDVGFLRNMSFNILQGARMRNTKTGVLPSQTNLPGVALSVCLLVQRTANIPLKVSDALA